MRLKELEARLQTVGGFERPKVILEQYETPAHLAAQLLFTAESSYGEIADKVVVDLGCGCGMLSIGCVLLGARSVIGMDVDEDALGRAKENISQILEGEDEDEEEEDEDKNGEDEDKDDDAPIMLMQTDIRDAPGKLLQRETKCDTVVMNPPFGTKTKGIDMVFLEMACKIAGHSIYSLHKSSTREYISRKAKEWGFEGEVIARMRYNLGRTMAFHRTDSVDIDVDLWRFGKNPR